MSLLNVTDTPDYKHFLLYYAVRDLEKRAEVKLSGLLQVTANYLIVSVPTALVRGIFDAMHEPGISLPSALDEGGLRAGIVVMTPDELQAIGGPSSVSERGKQYTYTLGKLQEAKADNWPGISSCWHLRVHSPDLTKLRRSYGLPAKIEGKSDFSIVVACRKLGVLASNSTSKTVTQQDPYKLPNWTLPIGGKP
jgi:hypothetical protein